MWETATSLFIGIGLSAACGFRVFVPALMMGFGSRLGLVELSAGFEWIGSWPAIAGFGVATLLEVGAYFLPFLDNMLDSVALPGSVAAGTLATMAVLGGDMPPMLAWALAAVAGGGSAGTVQLGTMAARAASSAATAGTANPAVSAGELGGSIVASIVAILLPVVAFCLAILLILLSIWTIKKAWRFLKWARNRGEVTI